MARLAIFNHAFMRQTDLPTSGLQKAWDGSTVPKTLLNLKLIFSWQIRGEPLLT